MKAGLSIVYGIILMFWKGEGDFMGLSRAQMRGMLFEFRNISAAHDGLFLEEIELLENMLEEKKYKVVVIGEFSTGKSTFLNALMGRETLFSSLREATGVVTYVEHGPEQMATIYYENQEKKSFYLKDEQDSKELKKYIDRKSKDTKPSYVSITTPELQFDKEVTFVDTPGLQGIDGTELNITKEAIKEANATIVLTTENGFSGTELDIISGRNMKFGKIRTKDVFVVINQIGRVYEGKDTDDGDAKVQQIIREVQGGLDKEGLDHVPVFAVDSRDYLWSKDNTLYQLVKKNVEMTTTGIQDQAFYQERSRFVPFKNHLMKFLSTDQRNINFSNDITEKLSYIMEAFEEELAQKEMQDDFQKKKQLDILRSQQGFILNNRRKLFNSLIRAISQSIDTFKDKMEEDVKKVLNVQQKGIVALVDQHFPDKNSLSDENMSIINKNVFLVIRKQKGEMEDQLSEYYHTLLQYLIDKTWTEAFQRIFKEQTNVKMKLNSIQVTLDLNWEDVKFEEEEQIIHELKREESEKNETIKKLEKEKSLVEENVYVKERLDLRKKKAAIEQDFQQAKHSLGNKPEPKQKYKFVERKRKKFLIFNETYKEEVPNGLDYSSCEQWEKDRRTMTTRYYKDLDLIDQQIDLLEEDKRSLNKLKREISNIQDELQDIKEEMVIQERHIAKKKQEHENYFVSEKKMQLVRSFRKVLSDHFSNMQNHLWERLYQLEKNVKDELKQEIDHTMTEYESDLNHRITEIEEKITGSTNQMDDIMKALTRIKGDLVNEL